MASYSTNEFRGGVKLLIDGDPYNIIENELVKPGKGQAFNRVRMRNLTTGRVLERTFKSGESVEAADVVDVQLDYSYTDGEFRYFMHPETFEQFSAGEAAMADAVIVEGVGGWLVPINERQTMQDVAVKLNLPVILVVGIRLGCLNHALLTAASIGAAGLVLVGWIANRIDKRCENPDDIVQALQERLGLPPLADFPFAEQADWPRQQYRLIDLKRLMTSRASS